MKLKIFDIFSHYYANRGFGLVLTNFILRMKKGESKIKLAIHLGEICGLAISIKNPTKFVDNERCLPFLSKLPSPEQESIKELESFFKKFENYFEDRKSLFEKFEKRFIEENYSAIEVLISEINELWSNFMKKMQELKIFNNVYCEI